MNVLYISSKKGWGGIMTWVHHCALGLEKRGHRAWVLSHPDSTFSRAEPRGIRVLSKKLGMDFNPYMIGWLMYFIRKHRVAVVVTNIKKEVVIGGLAAKLCGIPNVRMIGSPDDLNETAKWYQLRLVNHSVIPADATLRQAASKVDWLDAEKFTTVYVGRNPVSFSGQEIEKQRSLWGVGPEHLVLGCTAQLAAVKGMDGLIRVFKRVLEKHPACRLVLTGEGPERERLEKSAGDLGMGDRVVFPGFSREPTLAGAAYDIAILNSHSEGFPNTLVEYFAAGKAVVTTNVGGIPEMVEDGKNGFMIPPGDDGALLEKVLLLIENPDLRSEMGLRALATLKAGFTEDIMVEAFERVLSRVVAGEVP